MSGIEAVGLALAVIPILSDSTTHYKKVLEPIRLALQPDRRHEELLDFYRKLNFELAQLKAIIHTVLNRNPEWTTLRSDTDILVERFDTKENRVAFEDRFGDRGGEEFVRLVGDNLAVIERIIRRRGLGAPASDKKPPTQPDLLVNLNYIQARVDAGQSPMALIDVISFSKDHAKRQKALKKVRQNNKDLERWVYVRTDRSFITKRRSPSNASSIETQTRSLFQRLYDAFSQRWNCACKHQALLSLPNLSKGSSPHGDMLRLMISTHYSAACLWQESDVAISWLARFPGAAEIDKANVASSPHSPARSSVDDFCRIIKTSQMQKSCLSLEYDGAHLWHTIPPRPSVAVYPNPCVTLGTVFNQSEAALLKAKRSLAVVLAKSLLRIGDSPWLTNNWNKNDVVFLSDGKVDPTMMPYVTTRFKKPVINGSQTSGNHPNASVLALGILLLELHHWKGIEQFTPSRAIPNGKGNGETDLVMAVGALESFRDDLPYNYRNVIDACVYCGFADGPQVSLQDDTFRQGVQDYIIGPLVEEFTQTWPDSRIIGV